MLSLYGHRVHGSPIRDKVDFRKSTKVKIVRNSTNLSSVNLTVPTILIVVYKKKSTLKMVGKKKVHFIKGENKSPFDII